MEHLLANSNGDLDDLIPALITRPNYSKMTEPEVRAALEERGHCSVAVKVRPKLNFLPFLQLNYNSIS